MDEYELFDVFIVGCKVYCMGFMKVIQSLSLYENPRINMPFTRIAMPNMDVLNRVSQD
jgi:hypothetical protein